MNLLKYPIELRPSLNFKFKKKCGISLIIFWEIIATFILKLTKNFIRYVCGGFFEETITCF